MASEREIYRRAFYKKHPEGGKIEENHPCSFDDKWKYQSGRGWSDKETVRVFYTRDGVVDPFKTYSSSYLDEYIDKHPIEYDEDEIESEIERDKEKKRKDKGDDDKGCCGAWYCCPFRCSWKILCSFFG